MNDHENPLNAFSDPAGYLLRQARLRLIDISEQVAEPEHRMLLRSIAEDVGAALSFLKRGGQDPTSRG